MHITSQDHINLLTQIATNKLVVSHHQDNLILYIILCYIMLYCLNDAGSSPQGSATLATPETRTRAPGLQPSFGPSQGSYQSALSPASAAAARSASSQSTQSQASAAGSAASGAAAPPGVITLSGSSNSGNSFASIEGGLAESPPADGGNTAAGGLIGPALAPGAALAPNSRSSGSAALQSQNGGNASASIEGIPANGGGGSSSPSGPALAPSAVLAPTPSFNVTNLAGTKSQLSRKWWLWLLVALATLATWLCCCCCMGAVVVLLQRRKRRIM